MYESKHLLSQPRYLGWLTRYILVAICLFGFATVAIAQQTVKNIDIAYIKKETEVLPKMSNIELPPEDDGALGGEQGIKDSNTTGRFLGHKYSLESVILGENDEVKKAFDELFKKGIRHFVVNLSAEELLATADSEQGKQSWFYNIDADDDFLRTKECRQNIFHITPSYAMRADALAQYLIAKKWDKWFLVEGKRKSDAGFAVALRKAAKKFGGKIVAEKKWDFDTADMRRTAASTVPVFTQDAPDYDVLIVADMVGEFGEYLMYKTWEPMVVVGSQGLTPVTWHQAHEQWGAAQIQKRFRKNFGRNMSEKDYGVWSAVRSINEAVTRSQSVADEDIAAYIRSEKFELAGYKGQPMTFRTWNQQLRQPILLVSPKSLVSVSPQNQFLHQRSQLDTLGFDDYEVECKLNEVKQ